MAVIQAEDVRAKFQFMGDLNGHRQKLLGSTTTNHHGVAALDFAMYCSDQLVIDPTHGNGGTPDLLTTDVPDLVQMSVVAPLGNTDHSSLSTANSMSLAINNLHVSMKVFLKRRVSSTAVCAAMRDLPWRNIWTNDNPVKVLTSCWGQTFAFRTRKVWLLLRQWISCWHWHIVHLFLKRTADVLACRLVVVFPQLLRVGSFSAC